MMFPTTMPTRPSHSVLPAAQTPMMNGWATIPTRAWIDIMVIKKVVTLPGATSESIVGSATDARIPDIPSTAEKMNGRSMKEKRIVSRPCT